MHYQSINVFYAFRMDPELIPHVKIKGLMEMC